MIFPRARRSAVLLLACAACACGVRTSDDRSELDGKFRQVIPGRWRYAGRTGQTHGYMEKTYYPDGTAEGFILLSKRGLGVSFQLPQIRFKSRWRVSHGVVECYDIRSVPKEAFEPSEVIQDRLVSVQPNRIETVSVRTGGREVLERVTTR